MGAKSHEVFNARANKKLRTQATQVVQTLQNATTGETAATYFNNFDPSGTYGSVFGTAPAANAFPKWGSYTTGATGTTGGQMYTHYKLNWVKIIYQLDPLTGAAFTAGYNYPPNSGATIYERFMYQETSPVVTWAFNLPKLRVTELTPEKPIATYKVYPKSPMYMYVDGTFTHAATRWTKSGVYPVAQPGLFFGHYARCEVEAYQQVKVYITYDITFYDKM